MIEKENKVNGEEFLDEKDRFGLISGFDAIEKLKKMPPRKILWNDISEGSLGLFVGQAKTGKSTFAENLGFSIATGKDSFFGYELPGSAKKVLFIGLEESFILRTRRNEMQRKRLVGSELENFKENYIATDENFVRYINSQEDWKKLHECIAKSDAEIVFIDSLTHLYRGPIENSETAQKVTKNINCYLRSLKKTVIIIHHTTKSNSKPVSIEEISGSRIISQETDFALGFARIPTAQGGNYCTMIYNKEAEVDTTRGDLYEMDENRWINNLGGANIYELYQSTKSSYSTRDRRKGSPNKDHLLTYIKNQDSQGNQMVTTKELDEEFVESKLMSKDTLHYHLRSLEDEGSICKPQRGQYQLNLTKDGAEEE